MRKLVMSGPTEKNIFLFQFIYFIMITSFFLNLSNHLIFELRFLGIKNRIRAENEIIECKVEVRDTLAEYPELAFGSSSV